MSASKTRSYASNARRTISVSNPSTQVNKLKSLNPNEEPAPVGQSQDGALYTVIPRSAVEGGEEMFKMNDLQAQVPRALLVGLLLHDRTREVIASHAAACDDLHTREFFKSLLESVSNFEEIRGEYDEEMARYDGAGFKSFDDIKFDQAVLDDLRSTMRMKVVKTTRYNEDKDEEIHMYGLGIFFVGNWEYIGRLIVGASLADAPEHSLDSFDFELQGNSSSAVSDFHLPLYLPLIPERDDDDDSEKNAEYTWSWWRVSRMKTFAPKGFCYNILQTVLPEKVIALGMEKVLKAIAVYFAPFVSEQDALDRKSHRIRVRGYFRIHWSENKVYVVFNSGKSDHSKSTCVDGIVAYQTSATGLVVKHERDVGIVSRHHPIADPDPESTDEKYLISFSLLPLKELKSFYRGTSNWFPFGEPTA